MKFLIVLLIGLAAAKADKIVGGEPAGGPISYQARIQYNTGGIRCGGSLVNSKWIVSAAHCSGAPSQYNTWTIVLGMYDSNAETEPSRQSFGIDQLVAHPDYNSNTMQADAMVIKVSGTISMKNGVNSITLPAQSAGTNSPAVGTAITVSGWGMTYSGGSSPIIPSKLMEVDVNVVAQKNCRGSYSALGSYVYDDMICLSASGRDSCYGDSGGPAASDNVLVGIVSWGNGCAVPGYPSVYTRVSYYADWINGHIST